LLCISLLHQKKRKRKKRGASGRKEGRMSLSLDAAVNAWDIDDRLIAGLRRQGVEHFFAVQCKAIPAILTALKQPAEMVGGDICVGAPTGSGKTLVYVVPILQVLIFYLSQYVPRSLAYSSW
jgi:superfamily II DNA/RNA helicase